VDDHFGVPTVTDIIKELDKPGRDPRPEFKTAQFADDIETMEDLKLGMIMEGTVTNVTNFGAFVDIGVHQDGLVHISALSNKFVDDPRTVVKAGDIVKVKVIEVDIPRKRIALTMRLDDPASLTKQEDNRSSKSRSHTSKQNNTPSLGNSAMGNAFAAAFKNNK
jgi:protein Tex